MQLSQLEKVEGIPSAELMMSRRSIVAAREVIETRDSGVRDGLKSVQVRCLSMCSWRGRRCQRAFVNRF